VKKRATAILLALGVLVCSALACAFSTPVPVPTPQTGSPKPRETAVPAQTEASPTVTISDIPASLICRENPGYDLPFRTWRNADFPYSYYAADITGVGPAADGENVWLSTTRGLARLNLKSWQCDLITQAADAALPATLPVLLPDDTGGFWIGADEHLLRLSDDGWQVTYKGQADITAIGLSQTGDLCLNMYRYYHRGFEDYWLCFEGSDLPLPPPTRIDDCYGENCPLRPSNCDTWRRMSGQEYVSGKGFRRYAYTTPGECQQTRRIHNTLGSGGDTTVLVAFTANDGEVWSAKSAYEEDTLLLYQRDGISHQEEIPYYAIGLMADHVRGGAWLATQDGLVYVEANATGEGLSFFLQPLPVDLSVPSLDTGPFPGEARGLTIDRADQAWAVNGGSVLLCDETAKGWQEVASPKGGADIIAADPERGVWVAGRSELTYLDGTHRQVWPMPDTLTGAPTALVVDRSGRVWMGTTENGVWTAVPSSKAAGSPLDWRVFAAADDPESASVTAMAQAPDGRIYAAHLAGISVFGPVGETEDGRWATLPGSRLSERGWVNALAFTPTGILWAGTHPEGHLQRYDGTWTDYSPSWYSSIGALLVDSESTLWAGANEVWGCGELRYRSAAGENGETDWQVLDPKGLAVCNVLALAQDSHGRIWIGGPRGVVMWEGAR
jgi:ligand-binding sensor domain-containing protein